MGAVLDCNSIASPVALIEVLDAPSSSKKLLSIILRSMTLPSGIVSSHLRVMANGWRGAGPVEINLSGCCSWPIFTSMFLVTTSPAATWNRFVNSGDRTCPESLSESVSFAGVLVLDGGARVPNVEGAGSSLDHFLRIFS